MNKKRPPKYVPTKRQPGSMVQQAPVPRRPANRGEKTAKLFEPAKLQHGLTEAAFADLTECYRRHWQDARTIRHAGKRSTHVVGNKAADTARAEWLAERAVILAKHHLAVDLPIFERFGIVAPVGRQRRTTGTKRR